uniref:Uncharacterized protein n=1 Tax=Solanum lycopersicum TaxID=4081 RepID=A0A3Q7ETJ2_SOLLC
MPKYFSSIAPNRSSNNLPAIGMASPVVQYNDETCGTFLVEGTREGENVCLRRCTIWAMPGPCLCRLQHSLQKEKPNPADFALGKAAKNDEDTRLYHPLGLRYFLLGSHYCSAVNNSESSESVF